MQRSKNKQKIACEAEEFLKCNRIVLGRGEQKMQK